LNELEHLEWQELYLDLCSSQLNQVCQNAEISGIMDILDFLVSLDHLIGRYEAVLDDSRRISHSVYPFIVNSLYPILLVHLEDYVAQNAVTQDHLVLSRILQAGARFDLVQILETDYIRLLQKIIEKQVVDMFDDFGQSRLEPLQSFLYDSVYPLLALFPRAGISSD
jgi:hypothetical protein